MGKLRYPFLSKSLTTDWRRSAARTKSRGDKGSPCLNPLLHLNCLPGMPFNRTDEDPVSNSCCTQILHFNGKPLCFKISRMASCSIESKAFSKSILSRIRGLLDWWHWCRYSKAQAIQSWIDLSLMNC